MPLQILMADDHPIVLNGLKSVLESAGFKIIAEASDGHAAVLAAREKKPDIVLLDLSMPKLNGIGATRQIVDELPRTKVILLTMHREEKYVIDAFRAGVHGYLVKSEAASCLVTAIREVSGGNRYISPSVSRVVVEQINRKPEQQAVDPLSPREIEVLTKIAEGLTTRETAAALQISESTTESYRTSLMQKLDLRNTAALVRYAVRRGLVKP